MPIAMTADTLSALGSKVERSDSRSLYFDRFADPSAKDKGDGTPRKDWFRRGILRKPLTSRVEGWHSFASQATLQHGAMFYAQVQSRLLISMAGGVMENAGLCLDRYGIPYIPGSAVKGCARRMAIQSLLDARESCEQVENLSKILAATALVFGWADQDWDDRQKGGRFTSDLVYAVGKELWPEVSSLARKLLPAAESFGGSVGFLPSYLADVGKLSGLPSDVPELGKLELDVITCHHGDYYSNPAEAVASDTEEPVPVVFPAVAAGQVFVFAVLPLRDCKAELLTQARTWLANGLELFGLGAKTAAGYGWFVDVSVAVHRAQEASREARELEDKKRRAQSEIEAARANLKLDADLLEKLKSFKEPDLRSQINQFSTEPRFWTVTDERVQLTVLHFLCVAAPGLFLADRAKPSSKIAKAIGYLSEKFPHILNVKS